MEKLFWDFHSFLLKTYFLGNTVLRFSLSAKSSSLSGWWQSLMNRWKGGWSILEILANRWAETWYQLRSKLIDPNHIMSQFSLEERIQSTKQFLIISFWPIFIQEGGKLRKRKKKSLALSPVSVALSLSPFGNSKHIYFTFFQCVLLKKREVINVPCELGCHGEAVPGKE